MERPAIAPLTEFLPLVGAMELRLNLFDAALVIMLGYGFHLGNREGASGLWLSAVQWLLIALPGGLMGGLMGSLFRGLIGAGPYWSQISGYACWLVMVWGVFAYLRSEGKDEAIDGDKFGRLEYPLGTLCGVLRNLFIVLTVISFLNARVYTRQQLAFDKQQQIEEFGTALFPTRSSLHGMVYNTSFFGPRVKFLFGWALLQPAPPPVVAR